jgi:hypothetical protein
MSETRPGMPAAAAAPNETADARPAFPGLAAFLASAPEPEDKLIAQLAFAMAAEAGTPPRDADAIRSLRDRARAALSDFAFRYLHNRVAEIRAEAVAEASAASRRGPSFLRLVLANLVALGLCGAAFAALTANPHLIARLTGH